MTNSRPVKLRREVLKLKCLETDGTVCERRHRRGEVVVMEAEAADRAMWRGDVEYVEATEEKGVSDSVQGEDTTD